MNPVKPEVISRGIAFEGKADGIKFGTHKVGGSAINIKAATIVVRILH